MFVEPISRLAPGTANQLVITLLKPKQIPQLAFIINRHMKIYTCRQQACMTCRSPDFGQRAASRQGMANKSMPPVMNG
jgi:hypothetical protein